LPLLQLAYDRHRLPKKKSQNQLEQDALLAVVEALPAGVHPVILADRGFARATFFAWLNARRLHYVVRLKKGTCLTARPTADDGSSERKGSRRVSCVGHPASATPSTTAALPR
jgi:hypothetical protein